MDRIPIGQQKNLEIAKENLAGVFGAPALCGSVTSTQLDATPLPLDPNP
jgi:hypothetical protein